MTVFNPFRQVLACFSDHLKVSDHRVHCFVIPFELNEVQTGDILLYAIHRQYDFLEVKDIISFAVAQTYFTWVKTGFFIRSFKASMVTRSMASPNSFSRNFSRVKNSQPIG